MRRRNTVVPEMDKVQAPSSPTSPASRLTQSQRPTSAGDLTVSADVVGGVVAVVDRLM